MVAVGEWGEELDDGKGMLFENHSFQFIFQSGINNGPGMLGKDAL